MKNLAFVLLMFLPLLLACSESTQGHNADLVFVTDVQNEVAELDNSQLDIQEEVVDPSSVYPFPDNFCVECQWYFCSDLGAVWQKEIC